MMSENDVLLDPASSDWLRTALRAALQLDPVTAANEATLLARLLQERIARLDDVDERAHGSLPALR